MKIDIKKYLPLAEAILCAVAIMLIQNIRTTNALSILLIVGLFFFYRSCNFTCDNQYLRKVVLCVSLLLTVFMTLLGTQSIHAYQFSGLQKIIALAIIFAGMLLLTFRCGILLFQWGITHTLQTETSVTDRQQLRKVYWLTFSLILLCWLPFYLINYPGVVISDSVDQMWQAINRSYINHHPVVQTWLIQFIFYLCSFFTDNFNSYVAVYCCLQVIAVASIYAYTVKSIYEYGVKKWFCRFIALFFALMPYNIMFGINMWKDTLFSAFMLLFIVLLWRNTDSFPKEKIGNTIVEMLLLFLSGFCICMFRNNGFLSFLFFLPFAVIILWKSKKKICITLFGVILAVLLVRGPVFSMLQVSETDTIESLSIPAQQIASVIAVDGNITAEQRELLNQIVDVDRLPDIYFSECSDPVKNLVREKANQEALTEYGKNYLKLWISLGIKNPGLYLQAYIKQTEGYWNPDIQNWEYTHGICVTSLPIQTTPLLPDFICNLLQKYVVPIWGFSIPVVGILWSIGGMMWVFFILIGFCIVKNKKENLLLFIPVLALWMTLMIATPVYAEFRYIYSLFLCMPIYIVNGFRRH